MISVMMSPKLKKTVGQARHQNGEAKMYNQWGRTTQQSSPPHFFGQLFSPRIWTNDISWPLVKSCVKMHKHCGVPNCLSWKNM